LVDNNGAVRLGEKSGLKKETVEEFSSVAQKTSLCEKFSKNTWAIKQ
jgi:hypothetical protein